MKKALTGQVSAQNVSICKELMVEQYGTNGLLYILYTLKLLAFLF